MARQVLILSGLRHGVGILTAEAAAAVTALSAAAPLLGIRVVAVPRDAAWPAPLAAALREVAADAAGTRTWLVVTGGLTAEDFEVLNTVLDDNRMLVTSDGARVPVPANASIIFVGQVTGDSTTGHFFFGHWSILRTLLRRMGKTWLSITHHQSNHPPPPPFLLWCCCQSPWCVPLLLCLATCGCYEL